MERLHEECYIKIEEFNRIVFLVPDRQSLMHLHWHHRPTYHAALATAHCFSEHEHEPEEPKGTDEDEKPRVSTDIRNTKWRFKLGGRSLYD
ncbi:MAG: hypothetical protein LQ340_001834 [Diploschistes diacapsis]|nr:MAG: hypothetical protein LQ340_001834 [Diploschistes diacapsis]